MTLEEEVKLMVNRILNGDNTVDVTDIIKLMVDRTLNTITYGR